MPGDRTREVTARLTELEATVRGLTQELVSAEERIRHLETAIEDDPAGGATKDTPGAAESEAEAAPEEATDGAGGGLDDIIVA